MQIVSQQELKPDVGAFLRLVSVRVRLRSGARPGEVADLAREAVELLGDLSAPAERDMMKKIDAENRSAIFASSLSAEAR